MLDPGCRYGAKLAWTVRANPVHATTKPITEPREIIPPDPETVRAILNAAPKRFRLYLDVAECTDARRGEVVPSNGTTFRRRGPRSDARSPTRHAPV